MQYIKNTSLINFEAWDGGKKVLDDLIINHPKGFRIIEEYLEEECEKNFLSERWINDFLWFRAINYLENLDNFNYEEDCWEW